MYGLKVIISRKWEIPKEEMIEKSKIIKRVMKSEQQEISVGKLGCLSNF